MLSFRQALCAVTLTAGLALSGASQAGPIPYPNGGTENTTLYSFTAASTGKVTAYFYARSFAGYTNQIGMWVNGVSTGIYGLNNQTSNPGDEIDLGNVVAGDEIVFEMINLSPGGVGPWYSKKSMNVDGTNHVYSTDFSGMLGTKSVTGTYVGFEDLDARTGTDYNYTDEQFVFTNIATSTNVPEPGTLALVLIAGAAAVGRRRHTAAVTH